MEAPINTQQKIFIVEGNVGAGKSTFLKIIQHYLNVQVVSEPLERWQNVGGTDNLIEKFYQDMHRWGYTFQTYVFITRIQKQIEYAKKNPYDVQVLERSVFSDLYCFARNLFELGHMNELEWKLYQELFSWLVDTYCPKPTGFIYLQTDPDICYARLQKRARSEEAVVPFEYLERLHQKHENWLIAKKDVIHYLKDTPVLVLHCNKDFEQDVQEQEGHIDKIISFINDIKENEVKVKNRHSSLAL